MEITKHDVQIDDETRNLLLESFPEEGATLVHCHYVSPRKYINGGWVNINRTTYLRANNGQEVSLLHALNIPVAPGRHFFNKSGEYKKFTLCFPQLPKDWTVFEMVEESRTGEGFKVTGIKRNESGVYDVNIY